MKIKINLKQNIRETNENLISLLKFLLPLVIVVGIAMGIVQLGGYVSWWYYLLLIPFFYLLGIVLNILLNNWYS